MFPEWGKECELIFVHPFMTKGQANVKASLQQWNRTLQTDLNQTGIPDLGLIHSATTY